MTSPGMYWPGLVMLMFPSRWGYHHNLRWTDGLTVLARIEIVAIFTHNESSLWNPVIHCYSPMSLCAAGFKVVCVLKSFFYWIGSKKYPIFFGQNLKIPTKVTRPRAWLWSARQRATWLTLLRRFFCCRKTRMHTNVSGVEELKYLMSMIV